MDAATAPANYWDRPVLTSVLPVVEHSHSVRTSHDAVHAVALWMAHEEFTFPSGDIVDGLTAESDPGHIMDRTLLETVLNFAFTDFESGDTFVVTRNGRVYSDTEGMVVRIQDAFCTRCSRGTPRSRMMN